MNNAGNVLFEPREMLAKARTLVLAGSGTKRAHALPAFDIEACLVALHRYLLVGSPWAAERSWWMRGIKLPQGRWIEIREANAAPYYIFSDGKMGRSSPSRPRQILPAHVVNIPTAQIIALRSFYLKLIAELPQVTERGAKLFESHSRHAELIKCMYDDVYTMKASGAYFAIIKTGLNRSGNISDVFDSARERVSTEYENFSVSGRVAGDLLLVIEVLRRLEPFRFMFAPSKMPEDLLDAKNLEGFLLSLFSSSGVPGEMVNVVLQACEALRRKGEQLQDAAASKASTIGEFYGSLFTSVPPLRGANRGFKFLLEHQKFSSAPESARVAANTCDERCVIATQSMIGQFADSLDYRDLLSRKDCTAMILKKRGAQAAEDYVDQTLGTEMLYPPFVKEFLMNRTQVFSCQRP